MSRLSQPNSGWHLGPNCLGSVLGPTSVLDDSRISSGIANHKLQFLSGIILTWNPDNSIVTCSYTALRLALLTPYWATAVSLVPAGDCKGADTGEVFILIDWDGLMGCTWRVHVRVLSIDVDMRPGSSWLWKRGSVSIGVFSVILGFIC
jgi:hypothetical protein